MPFNKQQLEDFKRFREEIQSKDEFQLVLSPTLTSISIFKNKSILSISYECLESNFSFLPSVEICHNTEENRQHFITYYYEVYRRPKIDLSLRSEDFYFLKTLPDSYQSNSINLSVDIEEKRIAPFRMYFTGYIGMAQTIRSAVNDDKHER
jgi:hypothetical protein